MYEFVHYKSTIGTAFDTSEDVQQRFCHNIVTWMNTTTTRPSRSYSNFKRTHYNEDMNYNMWQQDHQDRLKITSRHTTTKTWTTTCDNTIIKIVCKLHADTLQETGTTTWDNWSTTNKFSDPILQRNRSAPHASILPSIYLVCTNRHHHEQAMLKRRTLEAKGKRNCRAQWRHA